MLNNMKLKFPHAHKRYIYSSLQIWSYWHFFFWPSAKRNPIWFCMKWKTVSTKIYSFRFENNLKSISLDDLIRMSQNNYCDIYNFWEILYFSCAISKLELSNVWLFLFSNLLNFRNESASWVWHWIIYLPHLQTQLQDDSRLFFSWPLSYIYFSSFTLPGSYFPSIYLPWLPCHFY